MPRPQRLVACVLAVAAIAGVWIWRARVEASDTRGLLRGDGHVDRRLDCDPCDGDVTWTGTWFFPRGGPYLFFLETLDGSTGTLEIDGEQVLISGPMKETLDRKGRTRVARRVYPSGAHAVTVTHSGSGRFAMYWLPPGRRGDPEVIPAEAFRPVAPSAAGADRPFGDLAFREEAIAYTVSLGALLALALFLLRHRLRALDRRAVLWGAVVFIGAAAIRLANIHAFGQTWDEDVYWSSGRNYLLNLADLDFRHRMWTWNYEHPPVAKYLLGLGALWHDGYEPARAVMALVSAGTCLVTFLIGREHFGVRVGAAAGLLAAFAPHLIAHGAISGLETPSTFFATLAAWLFLRRAYVSAGIAGGLAASSRFIAALVFFAMAGAALIELIVSLVGRGERRMTTVREWAHLALAPLAGFATMIAIWPRLWPFAGMEGPFRGLKASYDKLNVQHTEEWFFGLKILTPVPPSYFFAYFAAGMVPVILVGMILYAARPSRPALRLLPFFLAPFGIMFSPVIQSGLRYLLPVVPIACLFAAAGLDTIATRIRSWLARPVHTVAVLSALVSCLLIRPYNLDYVNALFGGPRAAYAKKRFIFGWWGEGIQHAVDHVNRVAPRGARVFYDLFPSHIVWLRDDFVIVKRVEEADFVLLNHFQWRSADPPPDFLESFAETVDGAPLVKVFARK